MKRKETGERVSEQSLVGAFASERDLQKRLEALDFIEDDASEAVYFRREIPMGGMVPDLVCIRFQRYPDLRIRRSKHSFRHAYLLWLLRQRGRLKLDSLARLTYDRMEIVRCLVEDLLSLEAVVQLPTGSFTLSKQFTNIQAEVIAVEAKLYKWNEAFQQALNYRRFADRVFVVMDYERVKRRRLPVEIFAGSGIGLVGMSKDKVISLNRGRKSRNSLGPEWEYLVSSTLVTKPQKPWVRR